jgi:hypothetical protein
MRKLVHLSGSYILTDDRQYMDALLPVAQITGSHFNHRKCPFLFDIQLESIILSQNEW